MPFPRYTRRRFAAKTAAVPTPMTGSWPSASIAGDKTLQTPTFDRVAKEGVLFHYACTASRGSILIEGIVSQIRGSSAAAPAGKDVRVRVNFARTGRIWPSVGDLHHPVVLYHYTATRARTPVLF
jgi:hypothetical protein